MYCTLVRNKYFKKVYLSGFFYFIRPLELSNIKLPLVVSCVILRWIRPQIKTEVRQPVRVLLRVLFCQLSFICIRESSLFSILHRGSLSDRLSPAAGSPFMFFHLQMNQKNFKDYDGNCYWNSVHALKRKSPCTLPVIPPACWQTLTCSLLGLFKSSLLLWWERLLKKGFGNQRFQQEENVSLWESVKQERADANTEQNIRVKHLPSHA